MGYGSKKKLSNDKFIDDDTVKGALEKANEIVDIIENQVDEKTKTGECADFFESVLEGVKGIAEKVEGCFEVSQNQLTALDNWEEAVKKFLHRRTRER